MWIILLSSMQLPVLVRFSICVHFKEPQLKSTYFESKLNVVSNKTVHLEQFTTYFWKIPSFIIRQIVSTWKMTIYKLYQNTYCNNISPPEKIIYWIFFFYRHEYLNVEVFLNQVLGRIILISHLSYLSCWNWYSVLYFRLLVKNLIFQIFPFLPLLTLAISWTKD